jgi:Flp pilus assembly protein TadD
MGAEVDEKDSCSGGEKVKSNLGNKICEIRRGVVPKLDFAPRPYLCLLALVVIFFIACHRNANQDEKLTATFVGAPVCAECHKPETGLWRGSHHDRAMQIADSTTVLGNFNNATFKKDGVTTTFFKKQYDYFVQTDGPDGKLHEYKIAYTFGVYPLQQYLVAFPGGRYQALSICWDSRPAAEGGQRWFHLYPNEKIDYKDILHWTGPYQNWNFMCAECHSTNLQKNYSLSDDRFATNWSEINVSCEACHGPGSRHVDWAHQLKRGRRIIDPTKALAVTFADTSDGTWSFKPGQAIATRTRALSSRAEFETCARCHARRAQIWREYEYGKPLTETHRVALLDEGVYHADGQTMAVEEVYEYGSFLQSKMYEAGVTCSDCHDSHSLRFRFPGNAICLQCHLPAKYDVPAHHFHKINTAAAQCVSCHMVERKYMVIDGRRDHSFRVPRPDLTMKLNTPNACNDCHKDRSAKWASETVTKWYGPNHKNEWHFGEALHAGQTGQPDAQNQLMQTVENTKVPGIVRATALSLLQQYLSANARPTVERAITDVDPLVRRAAAATLSSFDPQTRLLFGMQLLHDPIRGVRLETVPAVASVPAEYFDGEQRSSFDRAVAEYRESQLGNADRAETHVNLGWLATQLGEFDEAEASYRNAIRLQPSFIPAYINLADLYRAQNREGDAEKMLRQALSVDPDHADVHHALGLSLVRQNRRREGIDELAKAAQRRPDSPRYAYVYAVALHETGGGRKALQLLQAAHEKFPQDREILMALIEYHRDAGDLKAASRWAQKLVAFSPQDAGARQLLESLRMNKNAPTEKELPQK